MGRFVKNILLWVYLKTHYFFGSIGVALFNTENEILRADPFSFKESEMKIERQRHRNQLLEKFYAGKRDEKYTKDYYELLKKADKFMKEATPSKMEIAAYKYGTSYGMKDKYGRRYEHYGFFDEKHKHSGKTLGEVLEIETKERRTNDDEYPILYIINNTPIEKGLTSIDEITKEVNGKIIVVDKQNQSKTFEFPVKGVREYGVEVINKIEHLSEVVHVKDCGNLDHQYVQIEFFIPLKYKTNQINENDEIFLELINIKGIFVENDFGDKKSIKIINYIKRINHGDYEVWKFDGIEQKIIESKI